MQSKHIAFQRLGEIYFAMCKGVASPVSLGSWLRFRYGEFEQLIEKNLDPRDYADAYSFQADYAVVEYLKKYKDLPTSFDRRERALSAFITREAENALLNKKWAGHTALGDVELSIPKVRRLIATVLGRFSLDKVLRGCRWGPGSTATLPLRRAYLEDKYLEKGMSVTRGALPYFRRLFSEDIHWLRARGIDAEGPVCLVSDDEYTIVRGGRITTVSKNSKTDRTIMKEPTGNLMLQFGVAAHLRGQLLYHCGIDLSTQERNRTAALAGWSTIDLKNASNSVFRSLVRVLFPPDWADYLDRIRSPEALMPSGDWIKLEMLSSMGNGCTFELETLLFWAIARAAVDAVISSRKRRGFTEDTDRTVLVFGDDVACHHHAGFAVVLLLRRFGFEVNLDKSFIRGPFRESCGIHVYHGCDVTPVYQKEVIDELSEVYRAHNRLIRLSLRFGRVGVRDSRLRPATLASIRGVTVRHVTFDLTEDDGLLLFAEDSIDWKASRLRLLFRPHAHLTDDSVRLAFTLRFGVSPVIRGPLNVWRLLSRTSPARHDGRMVTCRRNWPRSVSSAPWI